MKKILSLVLSASLVLGSFGMAFAAPADVEGTKYEDAVTRLAALEVLGGYSDGTFKPEKTITRAEFAKIMANVTGVGAAAEYANGQTKFADVTADHWAAGYINVVSDMGIITGYGDGNFGPQDQVTYAQAITMIVRALGYTPKAKAMGGYPGGYLAVAAEEDVTDDVNVVATLAATRGDVSMMVNNSLTVDLMEQTSYGQYPEFKAQPGKNLMTTKLDIDEIKSTKTKKAIVTEIPKTDSSLDDNEIKINGDKYTVNVDFNQENILGTEIKAWAKDDEIFFSEMKNDEDDVIFDSVKVVTGTEKIKLHNKNKTYDWASDAKVYVNFVEEEVKDVNVDMYGYVVLNDKGDVEFANFFSFGSDAGIVTKVDGDNVDFVDFSGDDQDIDLGDYEDGVNIYNTEFVKIDADQIDVDSAFFTWKDGDEIFVVVKNETVTGSLDRVKSDSMKIEGKYYDAVANTLVSADEKDTYVSFSNNVTKADDLNEEQVTAVLGLKEEVLLAYGDSDTSSGTMYGVVTYAERNNKSEMTIVGADGEKDYTFETRNDVAPILGNTVFSKIDKDSADTALTFAAVSFKLNKDGEVKDASLAHLEVAYNNLGAGTTYDAITNGDKITIAKKADKSYFVDSSDVKYYISDKTVFMTALSGEKGTGSASYHVLDPEKLSYDKVESTAFGTFTASAYDTGVNALVFGDEGKDAKMVVFVDPTFTASDDDVLYGVVTEALYKKGGDYYTTVEVAGEGENEYVVSTKNNWKIGTLVSFHMNNKDEAVLDTHDMPYATPLSGAHREYNDGFFTVDNTASTIVWDKVASNVVIKELDAADSDNNSDDALTADDIAGTDELTLESGKISRSKMDRYDNVKYITDDEDVIVAAVVYDNEVNTPASNGWALSVDDNAGTLDVTVTAPTSGTYVIGDYAVAIYKDGVQTEIKPIVTSFATPVVFTLTTGSIYTVKVLKIDDLSIVKETSKMNLN